MEGKRRAKEEEDGENMIEWLVFRPKRREEEGDENDPRHDHEAIPSHTSGREIYMEEDWRLNLGLLYPLTLRGDKGLTV